MYIILLYFTEKDLQFRSLNSTILIKLCVVENVISYSPKKWAAKSGDNTSFLQKLLVSRLEIFKLRIKSLSPWTLKRIYGNSLNKNLQGWGLAIFNWKSSIGDSNAVPGGRTTDMNALRLKSTDTFHTFLITLVLCNSNHNETKIDSKGQWNVMLNDHIGIAI